MTSSVRGFIVYLFNIQQISSLVEIEGILRLKFQYETIDAYFPWIR